MSAALGRPAFCGSNFAVWRSAWGRVGGFDTDWVSAEDHNLSLKLSRIGKVRFCPDILVGTSARRHHKGMVPLIGHTISNYLRIAWLDLPPLPFENHR